MARTSQGAGAAARVLGDCNRTNPVASGPSRPPAASAQLADSKACGRTCRTGEMPMDARLSWMARHAGAMIC
jgi:hypothetical protein